MRRALAPLYDLAETQDGYFSSVQAVAEGVAPVALGRATKAGDLQRISRAVYRLKHFPVTSENAHLWAAVLFPQVRTTMQGTISHYTALRLHGLSDVSPSETHITVPKGFRIRRDVPASLILHYADLEPHDVEFVDGLPTTTVPRTLLDIAPLANSVVLHDALRDARRRNLPIPRELANV